MFFVSDVPNNGQNVLDIMVTKPNRERQKLMREQNILKQVCASSNRRGGSGPWGRGRVSRRGTFSHPQWSFSLSAASLHPFLENEYLLSPGHMPPTLP